MIFETGLKVWMGLTFYPIESINVLEEFRQRLSRFMNAIQQTTTTKIMVDHETESTFHEVMHFARSYNGNDQLSAKWYQYIADTSNNTLEKEHNELIAANLE